MRPSTVPQNQLFYYALGVSFALHLSLIGYFSFVKHPAFKKPLKQIEVIYQAIQPQEANKKVHQFKELKVEKAQPPLEKPQDVKILSKKAEFAPDIGQNIKDMSKLSRDFKLDKKAKPMIDLAQASQKMAVSLDSAEKITDPKYLNYYHVIGEKIRQTVYSNVTPLQSNSGEVYITFLLASNGTLKDIKIREDRTKASSYLRDVGLKSVQQSNPFPPFPDGSDYPELTFNVSISVAVPQQ